MRPNQERKLRLTAKQTWNEFANSWSGEPLRSWLADTPVRRADASITVQTAAAQEALALIIKGLPGPPSHQVALARLSSYSVPRWYEPVVELLPEPIIDPELASFFRDVLGRV